MSTQAETAVATQVYRVYIKASPEAIWDAITKPEWTQKYGYRGIVEFDGFERGSGYRFVAPPEMQAMGMPEVVVDGEVARGRSSAKARPDVASALGRGHRGRDDRASRTTSRRTTAASRG